MWSCGRGVGGGLEVWVEVWRTCGERFGCAWVWSCVGVEECGWRCGGMQVCRSVGGCVKVCGCGRVWVEVWSW